MDDQVGIAKEKSALRRGLWHEDEDERLETFVKLLGERRWDHLAKLSGLNRSGKSCRLRWLNYLRPNIKRGHISPEEEKLIIQLHQRWGNKWSKIARTLSGRTDNEIKNYWRTHLRKKVEAQENEGNSHCELNHAKQNFLEQKADSSAWKRYSFEDENCIEIARTDSPSLESNEISSYICLGSPFESRVYDWMSEISGTRIHGTGQEQDSCFCYPPWNSEESNFVSDADSLNPGGSLWDMN